MVELVPIDPEEIPATVRPNMGREILQKFLSSNGRAAHIKLNEGEKPKSIGWSLRRAIERTGAKVKVKTVNGSVYLQRS